jgi:nucleoside-diphosphate-sugar epimerase
LAALKKQWYQDIMKLLVTGGAGFIGTAVIRYVIQNTKNSKYSISGPYRFLSRLYNQWFRFCDFRRWKSHFQTFSVVFG